MTTAQTTMADRRCLLLAGGQSRRMGQDKAAMLVNGVSQLERTARLASQWVDDVVVSVRDIRNADPLRRQFTMIEDASDGEGPLAGILAALRDSPGSEWLVLACDLPNLDHATLAALDDAAKNNPDAPAVAIESETDAGLPEPMCAIWRGEMASLVAQRLQDGKGCARKCLLLAQAKLVTPVSAGALSNMNTPADAERWCATAAGT